MYVLQCPRNTHNQRYRESCLATQLKRIINFRAFVERAQQKEPRRSTAHTPTHQITCLCLYVFFMYIMNGSVLSRQSQCSARTYVLNAAMAGESSSFVCMLRCDESIIVAVLNMSAKTSVTTKNNGGYEIAGAVRACS
jgi:hypothetical protein